MCEYPPDGLMSPGSVRLAPAGDGAQTGQLLDETAADLALRATRYLRNHFRDRVTIGDLSACLAYSPSHLTRVFTAAVGTSPMDYLGAWRLHEAKHLLVTHGLGVAETCHEVGYTSVGTFSRRFLRDVGTPPGALRRIADRIAERTLPAERLAGFPCWIEPCTPDIDASAAFYRVLPGPSRLGDHPRRTGRVADHRGASRRSAHRLLRAHRRGPR